MILKWCYQLLQRLLFLVSRVERMMHETVRALDPNVSTCPDWSLLQGLRPSAQRIYTTRIKAFQGFLICVNQPQKYPAECDAARCSFIRARKPTVGQLETMIASLEKVWPHLRWKLQHVRGKLASMQNIRSVQHTLPMSWECCVVITLWIAMAGAAANCGPPHTSMGDGTPTRGSDCLGRTDADRARSKPQWRLGGD